MAERRSKARRWFVLVITGAGLLILLVASNIKVAGAGIIGVFGLLILVRFLTDYMDVRARRMRKEERRAARGARAEERIGAILDELGEDYFVLHDVSSLYGNIDHIVICKYGGVFLIETKAHGGRVYVSNGQLLVNGHEPEKDFIAQALRNTYWLRDRICDEINVKIWITPVLVFTNAFVERTAPIKGVNIINKRYLPNVLQRSNTRTQNLAAWENRERIQEALYATSDDEM